MKTSKLSSQACAVSIIMPCFNSEKFIKFAISSVIEQTFDEWELLVCDDGSTDLTLLIAEKFSYQDHRVKIMKNKFEKGAAGARNTCLSRAKGRYIAFLDSDDIWLPSKLENQLRFMRNTNAPFVFGYCENISEKGDRISITKAPSKVSYLKLLFSNFIPCLTVIYDSQVFGKVKQPVIRKRNDYALWLCMLIRNRKMHALCFPEVVARYRVNGYGLSANKLSGIRYFYRCLRQYAKLDIVTAGVYTVLAIMFKALKTLSPTIYNFFVTKFL